MRFGRIPALVAAVIMGWGGVGRCAHAAPSLAPMSVQSAELHRHASHAPAHPSQAHPSHARHAARDHAGAAAPQTPPSAPAHGAPVARDGAPDDAGATAAEMGPAASGGLCGPAMAGGCAMACCGLAVAAGDPSGPPRPPAARVLVSRHAPATFARAPPAPPPRA